MVAEGKRRDGWVLTYSVEVLFDTDIARSRYDHVGTVARCTCCGESFVLHRSARELARHARGHEGQFSVADAACGHTVAASATVTRKEVGPRP